MKIKEKNNIHETESLGSLGNTKNEKIAVYCLFLIISILVFSSFGYVKFLNNLDNEIKGRYSADAGILYSYAYDGSENNYKKIKSFVYSTDNNTLSYTTNGNIHILDYKVMVDVFEEKIINSYYLNGYLFIDGYKVINDRLDFDGVLGENFYSYKSQDNYDKVKDLLDVSSRYKFDNKVITINKIDYLVLKNKANDNNKVLVFSEDKLIYISDIYDENINYLTNGISFLSSCEGNKCVEKTIIINNNLANESINEINK